MKTEIPAGFYYRDSDHAYFFDGKKMTGCTTILGVLNKPALVGWAARMASEYIDGFVREVAVHADWEAMLEDGKWAEVIENAKKAHAQKRDEGAQKGTDTHAEIEKIVKDCIANYGGKIYRPWQNLEVAKEHGEENVQAFANWAIRENITFLASEQQVYSKELFIAGTFDLLFEKDGKRYIGDIKTYKKIWDRTPFYQCAGYALMLTEMNNQTPETKLLETIQPTIDGYCIINLPKEREFNEEEDVLYSFDVEGDTRAFLACVEIYRQNAQFKPNYKIKK